MIRNANECPLDFGTPTGIDTARAVAVYARPSQSLGQWPTLDWKLGLALAAGAAMFYVFIARRGRKARRQQLRKARLRYQAEAAAIKAA